MNNIALTGQISVTSRNFVINGNGHTISGNNTFRLFNIASISTAKLNNLTLTKGNVGTTDYGGAVHLGSGSSLTATGCEFYDNAGTYGGAVFVSGSFTAISCQFNKNEATTSGGVCKWY